MNVKKLFIVVNVDWFFLSHRLPVALAAIEAGWDVTIVTADTGKLKDIENRGLKVINLPMSRSGMNIFEELNTLNFLRKLYKRERPDVVHHVGMKTILWGTLAAKFSRVHGVVNAISGLGGFFAEDNKGILAKVMPMVLRFSHARKNLLCIFQNDDEQERFTFGLSTRFLPSRSAARVQWYLPLQLLMHHRGGEINPSAPNRGVKTWLNAAAGVGMKAPLRTRVPVTLGGEVTTTYFSQQKGTDLPFDSGYGLMAKAEARIWHFGLTVGYWQAHRFISVYGSPLFGAVSNSKSNTTIDRPHMAFAHLEYAQSLGRGFSWGVQIDADQHWQRGIHNRTENVYTTPSSTTDFAAGIFLRMTPSFLIKKFGAK